MKYDAKTDKYERALSYKKSDGSWYRKDGKTEPFDRAQMEKLYPAKVAHVNSISDVPVATLATTTAPATSPITTTTTALVSAPTVTGITPGSGMAGTTVNITGITGTNFRFGATVRLLRGTYSITGAGVSAISETNITCRFGILPSAETGAWNVTVINPDGQSGTLENAFTIINSSTTTQPTTTATTAPPVPTVSGISPSSATTGITINITNLAGSSLLDVTSVKLTKSNQSDISATNVTVVSAAQVTCTINLASAVTGQWNVVVTNSAGQSGIGTNFFTVNLAPPTPSTPPVGSSITPSEGMIGQTIDLTITGSNFKTPAKVLFNKGTTELEGANVVVSSATQITCVLSIPAGTATGPWSITVRNVLDKQNGTALNPFTINNAT